MESATINGVILVVFLAATLVFLAWFFSSTTTRRTPEVEESDYLRALERVCKR